MNSRTVVSDWEVFDPIIQMALEEDIGKGDITSKALREGLSGKNRTKIFSKQKGIAAGLEIVRRVFQLIDKEVDVQLLAVDGEEFETETTVVKLYGPAQSLLSGERTALNYLGRLSGIATLTSKFAQKIKCTKARILDTRKTTPGWRLLEKHAVMVGGGNNHRMGLYDMFLIKDNHIKAANGIEKAVEDVRKYKKEHNLNALIEIETQTIEELKIAIELGVDRILLDNMPLEIIKEAVDLTKGRIPLEVSGNVTLENVLDIAETGVDFISTGFITHSSQVVDFSMKFE